MIKAAREFGLALGLGLFVSVATAQTVGNIGSGRVLGNSGATSAPASPQTMTAMFDRAFCGTNGSVIARTAGTWGCQTGGTGDVVGPASSTNTAIARFNGTGGKTIQNSGVTIDGSNNIAGVGAIDTTGAATLTLNGTATGKVTTPRVLETTNATASTSSSTGALLVTGGAGIGGDLNWGGAIWSTSTPTPTAVTGTFTTATTSIRYKVLGKTVVLKGELIITTIGSAANRAIIPLPVNPKTAINFSMSAVQEATFTGGASGGSVGAVTNWDAANTVSIALTGAASGARIIFGGVYEAE